MGVLQSKRNVVLALSGSRVEDQPLLRTGGNRMRRLSALALAVALIAMMASGQASAAVGRTPTPTPAVTRPALVAATAPARRGVTLITGDSVRVLRDAKGRTIVEGLPASRSGIGAAFQTITTPAHTYTPPNAPRPYVGRFLDPSLFDVTAGTGARIPVRISF